LTPPSKNPHQFRFSLAELLSDYIPPSLTSQISSATTYQHNLDKQLTQINRPDGTQINFDYGSNSGLLNKIQTPRGNFLFNYQPNSNLVSSLISPDNEVLRYQYVGNILTQVKTEGTINSTIQYAFNNDATLSQINILGGVNIPLSYDRDNLLIKIANLNFTRNSVGEINASVLNQVSEKISFDEFGQISENKFQDKKNTLYFTKFYRDNLGRLVSVVKEHNNKQLEQYQYDKQARLTSVFQNSKLERLYKYDQNGNRTEAQYQGHRVLAQYDAQDRLIKYGQTEYQYNSNGDLITKIEHSKNDDKDDDDKVHHQSTRITHYNFDVFGNLRSVQLPNGKNIEYIIDSQNRRIGKKVNGKLYQGFIYQSQTQVAA
ncbi:MAG: hypothetical protein ABL927_14500, partial [Bdellovibrionales bacterium]